QVVLAIGDVERVADEGHPLRIAELGQGEGAVLVALDAAAGDGDLPAFQIGDDDAVVRAVGDEQTIAGRVADDLAGEEERRGLLLLGELEVDRRLPERLLRSMLFY